LTLPGFVLEPRSLLIKLSDFFSHPQLLLCVTKELDPLQRFLQMCKFYLSGWHVRPKSQNRCRNGVRNPLNPIIGEHFTCKWNHPDGSTSIYVSEQISHHPPHTAFCFMNRDLGIIANANIIPSYVKFHGNWAVSQVMGTLTINFVKLNEIYEMTLPSVMVRGLILGKLAMEITGKTYIKCEKTKLSADFEFKSKGFIRGKYNMVVGKIKDDALKSKERVLYVIDGSWDSQLTLQNKKTKETAPFLEPEKLEVQQKTVCALEDQNELESRRVWFQISKGIIEENEEETIKHKLALEEKQRCEAREREEKKMEWIPALFTLDPNSQQTNQYIYKYIDG